MPTRHIAIVGVIWGLLLIVGFANAGSINGIISDKSTGEVLPNTNVSIVGTTFGAASDSDGRFDIINVPAGSYVLKVSYIGYEPIKKNIVIQESEDLSFNFTLREDFFQTEQIVVTATRTEKLLQDVPVVTEFISREEIEEKGAEDLSEILEDRPGISIETGTTGGKFLFMNGVDSKRVLLLVDGVPVSGKLNNRNQLNLIDADKIDHIEIVKGPASALYGMDAMGGVINVITSGITEDLSIKANGRMGSNDLYSGNLSLSGAKNSIGYFVNIDHSKEGFDQGAGEIKVKDNQTSSVSGKLQYVGEAAGRLELSGEYRDDSQTSESLFMGAISDNESAVKNYNSSLKWNRPFGNKFDLQLLGYYSDNFRTYESVGQGPHASASIDTTTDNIIGLKSDFTFKPLQAIKMDVGFDYSDNEYDNPRLGAIQDRNQQGYFGQIEASVVKNLTLMAGGRYDKITDIDGHFSPRLSGMYLLTSDLTLRGSWGGGFRAPSFIELYSDFTIPIPGFPLNILGNSKLKPEKSTGGNVGLEYFWNDFMLTNVTYFHNTFEDMIVDYLESVGRSGITYSYLNITEAIFSGMELQSKFYLLDNLNTVISYNYTDINNKKIDDDRIDVDANNATFTKISPHTASIRINYGLFKNKLKISLREQLFSSRDLLVVSDETGKYVVKNKGAYDLMDLTFSYKFNNMLTFRLGTTNLTDYTDINFGPWIGRRVFFGIQTGI